MAESFSHKFGQIIGDLLEACVEPLLQEFAKQHNLFLDKKGERPARKGRKLTYVDKLHNSHDLDFVLERNGKPESRGEPVAFIETAWRRYTKHSRNKSQEIQGALLPLLEAYSEIGPFAGVILAGVFTNDSLEQLRSNGFRILYFPYNSVVSAFAEVGIDASFDEATTERAFRGKVSAWNRLSRAKRRVVAEELLRINRPEIQAFFDSLTLAITRAIKSILVVALHGETFEVADIKQAVSFIREYDPNPAKLIFHKFEITLRFTNGDTIRGEFVERESALGFLKLYGRT